MNKNQTIEQLLDQTESNSVQKIRKSPLQGIVIILIAIALIVLNETASFSSNGMIPPFIIMVAFGLITWGVLNVFIRETKFVDKSTHQKVNFHDVFFDHRDHEKLVRVIESGKFDEISSVKKSVQDGVKLRIASTPDYSICYLQVLTYISYHYALTSEAKKISEAQARMLFEALV